MKNEVKKELLDFLLMCFTANESTDYNVFFDFSGHVEAVHLRITSNDIDADFLFSETLYVDGSLYSDVSFKETMKTWKYELMKLINPSLVK